MALTCALEAAKTLGIKAPTLLVERGGDFDFHKISPTKFGGLSIGSIGEMFPCTNVLISESFVQTISGMRGRKEWFATSMDNFPLANSVIQITKYNDCMAIQDDTFQVVRSSINKEIETYIENHYGSRESLKTTLAIHLRMGFRYLLCGMSVDGDVWESHCFSFHLFHHGLSALSIKRGNKNLWM